MTCDVTLLRFILLTVQDRDNNKETAVNLIAELTHWFDSLEITDHLQMLFDAGIFRHPLTFGKVIRDSLTVSGAALADAMRDETEWQSIMPPHNAPNLDELRRIAERCCARAGGEHPVNGHGCKTGVESKAEPVSGTFNPNVPMAGSEE